MEFQIALIKGDGIGPEIVDSAVRVLEKIGRKYGHTFHTTPYLAGGCAIDAVGIPLPEETVAGCLSADSVLLGAVGGPKWDKNPGNLRPEKALLGLRSALGLFTNLRPAKIYPALAGDCPLRPDIVANGFDMVMVRELTGGIYFGERGRREGKYGPEAYDTECYSVMEIERIARVAFETARKRRKNVISIEERHEGLRNIIKSQNPDIIGFQEADKTWESYLKSDYSEYNYVWYWRGIGNQSKENEATPIFYKKDKFNLLDQGRFWLSDTPDQPSYCFNEDMNRIASSRPMTMQYVAKASVSAASPPTTVAQSNECDTGYPVRGSIVWAYFFPSFT